MSSLEFRPIEDIKNDILFQTDGGLDIIMALFPNANKSKNFKIRSEKTASASLHRANDGNWLVTDFGGDSKPKNAITLFAEENGLNWTEACIRLANDYGIPTGQNQSPPEAAFKSYRLDEYPNELDPETGYFIETTDEFSPSDLRILGPFVTAESCKKCHCYKVISYAKEYVNDKGGKYIMERSSTAEFPIFAFVNTHEGKKFYKIYQPRVSQENKKYKFMFIGGRPKGFVNGMKQLVANFKPKMDAWLDKKQKALEAGLDFSEKEPEKLDIVVICSGERDALNMTSLGYTVVWHNSETAEWEKSQIKALYENALIIVNIPDIDSTGIAQGRKLAEKYLSIRTMWLPNFLKFKKDLRGNVCKDLTDYFQINRHKQKFEFIADIKNRIGRALPLQFWESHATEKGIRWSFSNVLLNNFLRHHGFFRYEMPGTKSGWIFIRIKEHLVQKVEVSDIFLFIDRFLERRNLPLALRDLAITSTNISESKLARISPIELNFKDFSQHHQTFSFSHASWRVDKSGISVTDGTHSNYVWEDDVIDKKIAAARGLPPANDQIKILEPFFKISRDDETWDIEIYERNCDFLNFIINISRVYWRDEYITPWLDKTANREVEEVYRLPEQIKYREENRFNIQGELLDYSKIQEQKAHLINKIYLIGYMLHAYKDEANSLMAYLMENDLLADDKSEGGSGKSLFAKSFGEMMEMISRPGNNKDIFTDKFVYDGVTERTRVFLFDDADKYLDMRDLYSQISSDLYVNPKNGTAYTVPYSHSPKFMVTSNFGLRSMDGSTMRRLLIAATSNYYHTAEEKVLPGHQPPADFGGRRFFQNWDWEQYNKFINFYLQCLVFYLNQTQKINPPMNSIMKRNLTAQIGKHFMDWAEEFFHLQVPNADGMIEYNKVELKKNVQSYHKSIAGMSSTAIAYNLDAYCKLKGYEFMPGRDRYQKTEDGKVVDYIMIYVGKKSADGKSKTDDDFLF